MFFNSDNFITNFWQNTNYDIQKLALELFFYQYEDCEVYRTYCDLVLKNKTPKSILEIPFLPIQFFKTHKILCNTDSVDVEFKSSGTTAQARSTHYVANKIVYQQNSLNCFKDLYGDIHNYEILALLPSYIENGDSSLVYMIDYFIKTNGGKGGFYLHNFDELNSKLNENEKKRIPTILWGVTYALIDFSIQYPQKLNHTLVMETGGMKGRKKELTRQEVHQILNENFGTSSVHSEYGMTELLSQSYSKKDGIFSVPKSMIFLLRDETDPFLLFNTHNKRGAINIIDFANINSCCFIATDDLGVLIDDDKIKIEGRLDISDIRGCSQMFI